MCTSGKRSYGTYAAALAALTELADKGILKGPYGEIYQCGEHFHLSGRRSTLRRAKGRGKARRGPIFEKWQEGA